MKMKKVLLASLTFIFLMFPMPAYAARNVIEFSQLFMNRVDTHTFGDAGSISIAYDTSDIKSEANSEGESVYKVKCLAGTAYVEKEHLQIVELDMSAYSSSDGSIEIWIAKNIIAISALEYNSEQNHKIAREGEYADSVAKISIMWSKIGLSDAFDAALNGTDQLLLTGDNYDYYLHYTNSGEASVNVIAVSKEYTALAPETKSLSLKKEEQTESETIGHDVEVETSTVSTTVSDPSL